MSSGRFNYADIRLKNEIFGWADNPENVFEDKEISALIWDVLELIRKFDWYKSGDIDKEDYLESKSKFKKKWFSNRGVRIRRIVDDAINETKAELYETFGFDGEGENNLCNAQQTTDAVEVVRCKDCRNRGDIEVCPICCDDGTHLNGNYDDFFCADGERMTN